MTHYERIAELLQRSTPDFEAERLILETTETILRLMEKEGITRAELARRIGKSKGHISQLLNGDRNMTLRTLAEISYALGHRIRVDAQPLQTLRARRQRAALEKPELWLRVVDRLANTRSARHPLPRWPTMLETLDDQRTDRADEPEASVAA